ncbi:MAG TPA: hypothetical protein VFC07_13145, partial [Verrucomicrobiae bacterium]|nr:hypothetical protein [Verrucomicrobiae bacterium]
MDNPDAQPTLPLESPPPPPPTPQWRLKLKVVREWILKTWRGEWSLWICLMFGSVPVFVISAILLAGRSYALSIAQFAIASLNTLLAAEMTVHPKTVSRHAGKWRVGIVSLLCCGISVCGYQIVDQHKKEEDQKKKDSDTKQALVNITNIFKRELSETVLVMKKEMDERIGGVIRDFSTNNTTDPNVKVAILESQKHPAEQALEDLKKE